MWRVRVCYHIQSHRSTGQLNRLVKTVKAGSPDSIVHISHDAAGEALDLPTLRALPGVEVSLHRGGYGDFSHVDRYLAGLDWLVDQGIEVDWFVNLTGQDYPLRPLAHIEAEYAAAAATGVDGFMEYWPALGADSHWGARKATSRYYFRHVRLARLSPRMRALLRPAQALNRVQPLLRLHTSYGLVLGRRVRAPFGPDFTLYGGSAYSSLRWPAAAHLREFCRNRPDVVGHFRHTLSPEEAIFQTILVNSGRFTLVPDCKRYFDFTGSRYNHPRVLKLDDVPRALASGAHFGRKFDDARVLDRLDAALAAQY